jgi:hypothetical protein
LALSRVGHPHPSVTGSRSINCKKGVPQYDTPRRTTRIGQRSQTAALAVQSTAVDVMPTPRKRADAALAIAREIERNELLWHVKQAMTVLSDQWAGEPETLVIRRSVSRRHKIERETRRHAGFWSNAKGTCLLEVEHPEFPRLCAAMKLVAAGATRWSAR